MGLGVIGAFFRNPLIRSANQRPRSALWGRSRGHFPSLLDRPLPVKSHRHLRTGFPQVATQSSKDFHRMASKSARFPAFTQSLRTTCPPWRTIRPACSSGENTLTRNLNAKRAFLYFQPFYLCFRGGAQRSAAGRCSGRGDCLNCPVSRSGLLTRCLLGPRPIPLVDRL